MPRGSPLVVLALTSTAAGEWQKLSVQANLTDVNTPFSTLGCPVARPQDSNWVWVNGAGSYPSCDLPARGDIASMCVDGSGVVDYSSIYVNIQATNQRSGCFVWQTTGCSMNLRRVKKIEFDIDVTLCGDVWAAPLWMSPSPWVGGATSGEVDFAEGCPVGDLRTNFAGGGTQLSIGSAWGLGGPKHIIMEIADSADVSAGGTLTTQVCDLGGVNCHAGSYYTDFMARTHANAGKVQSDPYVFLADIWNGYGGDGGWYGCQARNNPNTNCQYAIRNIQVHTNEGTPMFSGHCSPLNADNIGPGPGPAPPPPPAPTLSGWVEHADKNCFPGHGADVVDGDDPTHPYSVNMTVSQCQGACAVKDDCTGIVVPSNGSPQCFRRKNINLAECLDDQGYNAYTNGKADLRTDESSIDIPHEVHGSLQSHLDDEVVQV